MWEVDLGTWCGGHFDHFLTKKKALAYALKNWDTVPFITLRNGDERIRIKDDPDGKQGDEQCEHHWVGEFGQIRCTNCNAVQKIACEHTGSVGCQNCATKFANDINNKKTSSMWKKYGDFCEICGLKLDENKKCNNPYCKSRK